MEIYRRIIRSDEAIEGSLNLNDVEVRQANMLLAALDRMFDSRNLSREFTDQIYSIVRSINEIKIWLEKENQDIGIDQPLFDNESRPSRISDFGQRNIDNLIGDVTIRIAIFETNLNRLTEAYRSLDFPINLNTDMSKSRPFIYECLLNALRILGLIIDDLRRFIDNLKLCFYNQYEPLTDTGKARIASLIEGFWESAELFKTIADNVKKPSDWSSREVVMKIMSDLSIRPFSSVDLDKVEQSSIGWLRFMNPDDVKMFREAIDNIYKDVIDVHSKKYDEKNLPDEMVLEKMTDLQRMFNLRDYRSRFLTLALEELKISDYDEVDMFIQMYKLYNLKFVILSMDQKADYLRKWLDLRKKIDGVIAKMQRKKLNMKLV